MPHAARGPATDRPRVILLNGGPSSGKSAIAAALQLVLPVPFLRVGVDDVIAMHRDRSALGRLVPASGGRRIELLPEGRQLMAAFRAAVAALVRAGQRVIVDDMFVTTDAFRGWEQALQGEPLLLVGVRCALDEAERRERLREDRDEGLARGHHHMVHAGCRYDIEVDTTARSPAECAEAIREAWATGTSDHATPAARARHP